MNSTSTGSLLWNQRITDTTDETESTVKITMIVPVVWMISLSKLSSDQKDDVKNRIGNNLLHRLCQNPEWDVLKYDLMSVSIIDLHKDYVRVQIILGKKL